MQMLWKSNGDELIKIPVREKQLPIFNCLG